MMVGNIVIGHSTSLLFMGEGLEISPSSIKLTFGICIYE